MRIKLAILALFITLTFSVNCLAVAEVYSFKTDFRLVPPDMILVNNVPAGPIIEIIDLAVTRAGHKVIWSQTPWKRTQKMAMYGSTDLLVRHSINDERLAYLSPMLMGYQKRELIFVTAPNKNVEIKSFDDLQKYIIGQQRGYFYEANFNNADQISKLTVNTHEQLVNLLKLGRVDAVVMTSDLKEDLELLLSVKGAQIADYRKSFINARYSSIPTKSPAIKYFDQINAEIFKLRKSGEMTEIMERHGAEPFFQDFTTIESKQQELKVQR